MSVKQLLVNLFGASRDFEISGVSYSGTLNIESGMVEIKSEHFLTCAACDRSIEISKNCKTCSRRRGNNLRFLAGRGDGVYSGLNFYVDNELAGALYVFDENNAMASAFGTQIDWQFNPEVNFQELLIEALKEYSDLEAFELGTIRARFDMNDITSLGFVIGDAQGSTNSTNVDHIFADGEYSVFLFMEPILESPTVALAVRLGTDTKEFDRGYKEAMRPRVALILKNEFTSHALKSIKLQKVDWQRQMEVWANTQVAANLSIGNAGVASYINAQYWWSSLARQMKIAKSNTDDYIGFVYHNRTLGYMLSGALLGNEGCKTEIINTLAEDEAGPESYTDEVLAEILKPRGMTVSNEARNIVKSAIKQSNF